MKKQSVLYGSFLLMLSVIVSRVAGLILKIPLANMLGGTGMGYYSSAYAVFMPLYALCAGSLPPAIAQSVSESAAFCNNSRIAKTKRSALIFFSAVSLAVSLVPLVFADFISARIIGNPEAKLSVMAISPCIFFGTVTAIYRGYYEGLKNMTPTAVSQMADALVKLVSGLGLAYAVEIYANRLYMNAEPVFGKICLNEYEASAASLPYVAAAAVLGTALADLAAMLYLILYSRLHKKERTSSRDGMFDSGILKELLRMIMPIALASLVSSLLSTIDLSTIILMIKLSLRRHPELYAERYAAVISSGVTLKELPNFLYGSFTGLSMAVFTLAPSLCAVFSKSAFPKISECYAKRDVCEASREIRRAVCLSIYISLPAGLGIAAFSRQILGLLFSSRYAEIEVSSQPLTILALSTAFLAVSVSCYTMLQAIGRADLPVKITLVGAVIKLILNIALIPLNQSGLSGAAASTVISYFIMCVWSIAALYRITGTKPRLVFSVIIPAVCSVLSVGGAKYAYNYLSQRLSLLISLCISVIFAVIIYILTLVLLDISTKNELSTQIFD